MMQGIAIACGGFLFAVLWFDLMFDVQVARHRQPDLPEPVLASIAGYYRRVTTDARPMGDAVGLIMVAALGAVLAQLVWGSTPRWASVTSLALVAGPSTLAARRVLPNAVRLGQRGDPVAVQSDLARLIYRDHLLCLAAIGAFLSIQLATTAS